MALNIRHLTNAAMAEGQGEVGAAEKPPLGPSLARRGSCSLRQRTPAAGVLAVPAVLFRREFRRALSVARVLPPASVGVEHVFVVHVLASAQVRQAALARAVPLLADRQPAIERRSRAIDVYRLRRTGRDDNALVLAAWSRLVCALLSGCLFGHQRCRAGVGHAGREQPSLRTGGRGRDGHQCQPADYQPQHARRMNLGGGEYNPREPKPQRCAWVWQAQ